jgi:hypothetical protein
MALFSTYLSFAGHYLKIKFVLAVRYYEKKEVPVKALSHGIEIGYIRCGWIEFN